MAKKIEVDERVIQIKTQMDNIVEDIHDIDLAKAELQGILDAKVQKLKDSFGIKIDTLNSKRDHLITELMPLFEQVPQSIAKTQRKVGLLNGDVVIKNATQKIDYNKDLLLDYARQQTDMVDYIDKKVAESFKWADFKAKLAIVDNVIINTETGEQLEIDGLQVVDIPAELQVK